MIHINTKNIFRSFFTVLLLLVPNLARAEAGDNCMTDLTQGLPIGFDWQDTFILEGDDGSAWQRAIITTPRENIFLDENLPVKIQGTAEKNSPISIFMFSPIENADGGLQIPSVGTCLQASDADENGYFSLTLDASVLWRSIDDQIVIDAFYKRDETYAELQSEAMGLSFGTFLPPQEYSVMAVAHEGETEGSLPGLPPPPPPFGGAASDTPPSSRAVTCDALCGGKTVLAMRLDPARTTSQILGELFDPVGAMPVVIGRLPGQHTFYAGLEDKDRDIDTAVFQKLTLSSVAAELLKRGLLGIENAGGVSPGIEILTSQDLRAAANEEGKSSDRSKRIAFLIKSILNEGAEQNETNQLPPPPPPPPLFEVSPTPTPETSTSPSPTPSDQTPTIPPTPPVDMPTPSPSQRVEKPLIPRAEAIIQLKTELELLQDVDLDALFPRAIPNDKWAEVFLQMLDFWTGGVTINTCLMVDDQFAYKNFKVLAEKGNQCGLEHAGGVSPLLVLHSDKEVIVKPDFTETAIVFADRTFDTQEGFVFAAGEKSPLYYRYDFSTPFAPRFVGEMCITESQLPLLIENIADTYALTAREKAALQREFHDQFPQGVAQQSIAVALADPQSIAKRFRWLGDEEPLQLLQLFFRLTPEACSASVMVPPDLPIAGTREGFEVGIIK